MVGAFGSGGSTLAYNYTSGARILEGWPHRAEKFMSAGDGIRGTISGCNSSRLLELCFNIAVTVEISIDLDLSLFLL